MRFTVGCAKELFVSIIRVQHTFASISESAVIVITGFLRNQSPYLGPVYTTPVERQGK